jgi:hypothetical protein
MHHHPEILAQNRLTRFPMGRQSGQIGLMATARNKCRSLGIHPEKNNCLESLSNTLYPYFFQYKAFFSGRQSQSRID